MKKLFSRIFMSFIGMALIFCAGNVSAKTFKIGVEDLKYYPHYNNVDGEYGGFAREILDAFATSKGYKFVYKTTPIKRLFKNFLKGAVDFKYPDNSYWSADLKKGKKVIYSSPVVSYIDGLMVPPKAKGNGISNINKIGTVRGFTPWTYLGMIEQGKVKVVENNSFVSLLKKTLKGRVQGAYLNVSVAKYHLKHTLKKPGTLVFDDGLPHTKSAYYFSTIKHPKVMKEFNLFLKKDRKTVNKLKRKYNLSID